MQIKYNIIYFLINIKKMKYVQFSRPDVEKDARV